MQKKEIQVLMGSEHLQCLPCVSWAYRQSLVVLAIHVEEKAHRGKVFDNHRLLYVVDRP